MTRSVDLFIAADKPLEEIAATIGPMVGTALTSEADGSRWVLRSGDLWASLGRHPYVDDRGLPFSQFPYALSSRVPDDRRPQDTQEAAMLRRIGSNITEGPGWPNMLVLDLQYRDSPIRKDESVSEEPAPAEPVSESEEAAVAE